MVMKSKFNKGFWGLCKLCVPLEKSWLRPWATHTEVQSKTNNWCKFHVDPTMRRLSKSRL